MAGPLAVIAGGGALPLEVANAAAATGHAVVIFRIADEADHESADFETHTLRFGQVGRLFDLLAARGCRNLLFVGTIRRRPDYLAIASDPGTLRRLPKIVRALSGGDDTVIRRVLALFEAEGYRVVPIEEVAPGLLAPTGRIGIHAPGRRDRDDIATGLHFLDTVAPFDVGQAAVVVDGRIVAVEAAEGTDAMLARCAGLRTSGRVRGTTRRGVLVKSAKLGQDLRTDLPVIGAATVQAAAQAGLAGIAVGAGRTIIAERAAAVAAADRAGLFIEGIPRR